MRIRQVRRSICIGARATALEHSRRLFAQELLEAVCPSAFDARRKGRGGAYCSPRRGTDGGRSVELNWMSPRYVRDIVELRSGGTCRGG
jgi:hypothetical protein